MSTYGDIRKRVVKEVPGVDLTLVDGYLTDRYVSILDKLRWQRNRAQYIFQTTAPYTTGTLSLTDGLTAVSLTGGTFTTGMTGLSLLVGGRSEAYTFTYTGATTGTLDRPFEGATLTTYTFQLVQSVYPLPSTTRVFENARLLDNDIPLTWMSRQQLNESLPSRPLGGGPDTTDGAPQVGAPLIVAPAIDSSTNPPQMQIEVVPAPDNVYSIAVDLISEAPSLSGTSVTLLPWVRPSCLVAYSVADAFAHVKDWPSSQYWKTQGNEYLADMARTENAQSGPMQFSMGSYYTAYRRRRGSR